MGKKSITREVSAYHDDLAEAVAHLRGRVVRKAAINEAFPDPKANVWVLPSDHSINHKPGGACKCAGTERALFYRVERGRYIVLSPGPEVGA